MNNETLFKRVSIGVVAENKPLGTNIVEVVPIELLPMVDGELKSGTNTDIASTEDGSGQQVEFRVNMSNSVSATWKGDATNRFSSPDVRRGSRVELWQYANTDKYYWSILDEPGTCVRKRETVTYVFSNTTDETVTVPTPDTHWIVEVSTHNKTITLKTNDNDGEYTFFNVQFDLKNGFYVIEERDGAKILRNAKEDQFHINTNQGGIIDLTKRKLTVDVDDIDFLVKNKTLLTGELFNVTANTTQIDSKTTNINSSTTTVPNGSMKVGASLGVSGNAAFTGGISHQGKSIGIDHIHNTPKGPSGPVM